MEKYESKHVRIRRPASMIYSVLSRFDNLTPVLADKVEGWTAEEVHYGRLLWVQNPPKMLLDYCRYRIKVMSDRLTGLASATGDVSRIRGEIAAEIDFYQRKITELEGALC